MASGQFKLKNEIKMYELMRFRINILYNLYIEKKSRREKMNDYM